MIQIPAFNEKNYTDHQANAHVRVVTVMDATEELFNAYRRLLEENDFTPKEARGGFAAYQSGSAGVFLSYYPTIAELRIVTEESCNYFSFADAADAAAVSPQITQIHLEDFGMSYTVRLSDGRFIVIDGGNDFTPEGDRLLDCLKEGSPYEKPIIAAWIMTHPHSDHFHCFFNFFDRYGEQVTIEKFLFYFPEADDLAHYPKLAPQDPSREDTAGIVRIPRFLERVARSGAAVYTPHTGQIYRIGDAVCEILASMDDTIHCSGNINATSLIIRMELSGQIILWATDASFSDARLPERYGSYLKADILQVPHHGFGCGDPGAQIEGFDLIRPETCLLPASDYIAYTAFSAFREGTRHLMTNTGISEMITGDQTRTLTLPYTPPAYAARRHEERYLAGQAANGSTAWVFTGLSTARAEDLIFTVLNTTYLPAELTIELFFEDPVQRIRQITTSAPRWTQRSFCITDPVEVESETLFYNPHSLEKQGLPENAAFSVRFLSNLPVVISHKNHTAAYHK